MLWVLYGPFRRSSSWLIQNVDPRRFFIGPKAFFYYHLRAFSGLDVTQNEFFPMRKTHTLAQTRGPGIDGGLRSEAISCLWFVTRDIAWLNSCTQACTSGERIVNAVIGIWYSTTPHSVSRSPSRAPAELRETFWSPGHLKDKQWPGARETARRLIHRYPLLCDRLE